MPRPLAVLAVLFAVVIVGAAALLYQADRNAVLKLARGSSPAAVEPASPTEIAARETPAEEQEAQSEASAAPGAPTEGRAPETDVVNAPAPMRVESAEPAQLPAEETVAAGTEEPAGKNRYFGEPKPEPEAGVAAPAEQVATTEPETDALSSDKTALPSADVTEGAAPTEPPASEPEAAVADASATPDAGAVLAPEGESAATAAAEPAGRPADEGTSADGAAPTTGREAAAPSETAEALPSVAPRLAPEPERAQAAPATDEEPAAPQEMADAERAATTEGTQAAAELHVEAAPQRLGLQPGETEAEAPAVESVPGATEEQFPAKAEPDTADEVEPSEVEPGEVGSGDEELEVASAGPSPAPATGGKEAAATPLPLPDQAAAGGVKATPQTVEDEPTPQAEEPPGETEMAGAGEPQPMASVKVGQATTSTPGAAAEADAVELSGPLVAGGEARTEELRIAAAAPSGIPDATDVTIKAAEAETGTLYVAGQAPAGALLNVYADGELVGEARAGTDGIWLLEAEKEVPAGQVVLRVEAVFEDSPGPTAVAEMPFVRHPEGVVLEPAVTAMRGEGGLVRVLANPPPPTYVIIRRGDNLWRIARRNYGRGIRYQTIFAANRDRIRNPHRIFPGQVFVIPTSDRSWPSASN